MIPQSSEKKLSIDFFSDNQIEQIFHMIKININKDTRRKKYHQRYFLLVKFLLRTGGRIDEVLQVVHSDIDLNKNNICMITLKQGKDKRTGLPKFKYRVIPLHTDLRDAYKQYLLQNNIREGSSELLFPMKRQVVDLYFKKIQNNIGIRVHAHKFRHTFAVNAIMGGVPLNVLQQWMGHSSVFTTYIYMQITGIDTSEFMDMVK
jgi:site-specific recombinase XerD